VEDDDITKDKLVKVPKKAKSATNDAEKGKGKMKAKAKK
jgi:hypothetical protein